MSTHTPGQGRYQLPDPGLLSHKKLSTAVAGFSVQRREKARSRPGKEGKAQEPDQNLTTEYWGYNNWQAHSKEPNLSSEAQRDTGIFSTTEEASLQSLMKTVAIPSEESPIP